MKINKKVFLNFRYNISFQQFHLNVFQLLKNEDILAKVKAVDITGIFKPEKFEETINKTLIYTRYWSDLDISHIDSLKLYHVISKVYHNESWYNFNYNNSVLDDKDNGNIYCIFCDNCKYCVQCSNCFNCVHCHSLTFESNVYDNNRELN